MSELSAADRDGSVAAAVSLSLLRRCAADGTARRLRQEAQLSLTDVATVCGVSKASVSKWERGLQLPRGIGARCYAQLLAGLIDVAE